MQNYWVAKPWAHTPFVNFGGFWREFLRNYLVYRAQIFRDYGNYYALLRVRNFILLASSDIDKPMLTRQKCKQGFAYRWPATTTN